MFTQSYQEADVSSTSSYKTRNSAYTGIITCEFYGAFQKFQRVTEAVLQFCWAHLIWEVLFLLELKEAGAARYGRRILKQIPGMFETIQKRREMEEGK
jgi:hypothetical protein